MQEAGDPLTHRPRVGWPVWLPVGLCLVAGPWLFYEANQRWPRVIPGMPAGAPNAHIAARSASIPAMLAAHAPVTDVLVVLLANEQRWLVGRPVLLTCVEAGAVQEGRGFWTRQIGTPSIFIAGAPPERLSPGRVVEIDGKVALREGRPYVEAQNIELLHSPVCGGI
jgi:hypothetical protein